MHETGLLDLLTRSGKPRTSSSCVMQPGAVADWWYSWPLASTLASLCFSQRRTFEHMLWLSVFLCTWWTLRFTSCLMQQVLFYECIIKVWNVMFQCFLGSVSTIFRWGGHLFIHDKKFLPLHKSIKIFQSYDHKCTTTFLWFTVSNCFRHHLIYYVITCAE